MTSPAASRGARGGRATLLGQIAKALLQMASVIVLSRMLPPSDFGLIAMVAVVVSLGELLRDFGMTTSGLRARTLTHAQGSNLFWVSSGLGLVASLLVAASAPLLVAIYQEPRLYALTPVLAVTVFLNGFQAQLQVQLARTHRYGTLALTDVGAQAVGFAVAVLGVLAGWGYWALAAQSLSTAFFLLLSRWIASGWVPMRPSRGVGSKPLLVSGADFGLAYGLQFVASNADTVMIGALWGATPLGLYNRAYQLLTMPISRLLSPLINVVVPTVNAIREEGGDVLRQYLRIQSLVGMASIGIFAVAAGSARALIPLVLGSQWEGSVPLFQILAVGGFALGLSQVSHWIFVTEGRSRELLKYNAVTKPMTVGLVVVGSLVSVEGAAWGYAAALLLSWPINVLWLWKTAGINGPAFLANGFRLIAAGIAGGAVGMFVPLGGMDSSLLLATCVRALAALVVYLGAVAVFTDGRRDLRIVGRFAARMLRR